MPFLFDTDILSSLMRPRSNLTLMRRMAETPRVDQFTSAISLGELVFGAERVGRARLHERIEEIVEHLPILPFDEAAARVYGPLRAGLERQGIPLADADLRIASIALATELTLVTGNVRHFTRVPGLAIENWLAP